MFYKYKISYYDNYSGDETDDEGLVCADNYGDAANKIIEDYGSDDTISITVAEVVINGEHCINKDDIDYAFKE